MTCNSQISHFQIALSAGVVEYIDCTLAEEKDAPSQTSVLYMVHSISFQTFFVQASKIVKDLKIQYVIAIHTMR